MHTDGDYIHETYHLALEDYLAQTCTFFVNIQSYAEV